MWSYNSALDQFIVSPSPDVDVVKCDGRQACMILGSDGLWNVVRPGDAVSIVNSHEWKELELETDSLAHRDSNGHPNVAKHLIRHALMRWGQLRADNISAICVVFDSPTVKYSANSGCVQRSLKYPYEFDDVLEQSPELMIRIGPSSVHLLRTMPVELVYFGQTDYGVTFGERRNIVTSADEYTTRATEFAGTFTFDSRDDGSGDRKEEEYSYFSYSSETTKFSNSYRTLKEEHSETREEMPSKPRYFCSKHGLTCEKVKRMNRVAAADEHPTAAPSEPTKAFPSTSASSSSAGVGEQRPRYWCRKHGLSCSKVKRMNEEWLRQRLLESSPRPVAPPVAEFFSSPEEPEPDDPAPTPSAPKSVASTGKLRKHHRYRNGRYSSLIPRYNLRDHVRTTRSGLRLSSPVKSTANRSKARALKRLSLPARRVSGGSAAFSNGIDANKSMPASVGSASSSAASSCLSKVRQDLKKSVHQFRVKHFKRQISGNSNATNAVSLTRWRERHSSGAYEFDEETYIINSLNLDLGGVIAERTRRKTSDMMAAESSSNAVQSNIRKRKMVALDDDAVLLDGQRKRSRFIGYCLRDRTIE